MDTVEELVCVVLGLAPGRITDELAYGEVPEWDSLNHVNLMVELESQCGREIDEDTMVELTSVRAIRAWLAGAGG